MLKILFWPVSLAMNLINLILNMTGRVLALCLGVLICALGACLCATVIGIIVGIPLCIFGGGLILRSIF